VDLLIYLSVALGVALLPQLYGLVPIWLFFSVLVGWLAYVVVAILAAKGMRIAYPFALMLAILTLVLSLPQPEHYSFVEAGLSLASGTFILGSALQLALLILIPVYLYRSKSGKA
jgi:lysylphosphatidylglycerol synthetase-like protein (DUF2156 family)